MRPTMMPAGTLDVRGSLLVRERRLLGEGALVVRRWLVRWGLVVEHPVLPYATVVGLECGNSRVSHLLPSDLACTLVAAWP
jgi:hypothetical protein